MYIYFRNNECKFNTLSLADSGGGLGVIFFHFEVHVPPLVYNLKSHF